jgi:hypothetical protein
VKRLVLGDDVGLEDSCRMAVYGLVGRMAYKNLYVENFTVWLERIWVPVIGYLPEIIFLTKGWVGIICASPEDVELLLSRKWINGKSSLLLKRWRLDFNPEIEYFSVRHIWVLLPGLPMYLWNEGALTSIGNSQGNFIIVYLKNLDLAQRKVAKVLVEMDVHLGLPEILEVEWRGCFHKQKLDYLGLPFRCSFCRSLSHLRRDCKGLKEEEEFSEEQYFPSYLPDSSLDIGFYGAEGSRADRICNSFLEPADSTLGKL